MNRIFLFLCFGFISAFANNLNVTVSILPQKYFVEQIAQGKVTVNVMVKPGFSPATYEPQTSQMKLLSKSQAYFFIGVPFESAWLKKFESVNKKMLMIDTTKNIVKNKIPEHNHHDASHQCQYCTVYGNLVLPPDLELKAVLDRIKVRLIAFQKGFAHVWFALQQLFLLPQGRAPPLFV